MFQQNFAKTGSGPDLGSWSGSPTPGLGYFQAFARTNATGLTVVSLCARTRNSLESGAAVLSGMHTFQPSGVAGWSPKCLHTEFTLTESPCQHPSDSVVVGPFHLSQADGCKMIPHNDFHLHFSIIWKLSAFSHLLVIGFPRFVSSPFTAFTRFSLGFPLP